jgi:hypothetical protein
LPRAILPSELSSIVKGVVFFTDTQRVWRIAPDGTKSVVVPDVHTHELYVDADGNLFGEHLRYVNERWEHRVWKRSPDGTVTEVIAMRSGFRDDHRDFFFTPAGPCIGSSAARLCG